MQLFTFKHTISKQIKITNQLSSVKDKHLLHFCPSTQYKAYSWLYIRFCCLCDSKLQPIKVKQFFPDGLEIRESLKNKTIFDPQECEKNALPNLRRWLTTSSRVIKPKTKVWFSGEHKYKHKHKHKGKQPRHKNNHKQKQEKQAHLFVLYSFY